MGMFKEINLQYYGTILRYLKINTLEDYRCSEILNDILPSAWNILVLKTLKDIIYGKKVFIFGAGPSLKESVVRVKRFYGKAVFIAANGASEALIEKNIIPNIVVTDLDGKIEPILKALTYGSIIVVHGHGDNVLKILKYVPKFRGKVLGTTQLIPWGYLENYGGFTDGDRALYLALHFGAKKIFLFGMDFGNVVGKYSKPWLKNHVKIWDTKKKKFLIAKVLIENAAKHYRGKVEIFIVPKNVENIKYVLEIKYDRLNNIMRKN